MKVYLGLTGFSKFEELREITVDKTQVIDDFIHSLEMSTESDKEYLQDAKLYLKSSKTNE
jgi:hypothetical protein